MDASEHGILEFRYNYITNINDTFPVFGDILVEDVFNRFDPSATRFLISATVN